MQELVTSIRSELVSSLQSLKKDLSAKSKKHQQDSRVELDKLLEESKANRDKIQKLAVQFDKELADRDKQQGQLRAQLMGDLQKLGSSVAADVELCRKQLGECEVRKADKRDLIEVKGFIVSGLDAKVNVAEIQQTLNKHTSDAQ